MRTVTRNNYEVGAGYAGNSGSNGCFGASHDCCVPGNCFFVTDKKNPSLTFVGEGRGNYEQVSEYKYVGAGGGSFQKLDLKPEEHAGQLKMYSSCIFSFLLFFGALAGLV